MALSLADGADDEEDEQPHVRHKPKKAARETETETAAELESFEDAVESAEEALEHSDGEEDEDVELVVTDAPAADEVDNSAIAAESVENLLKPPPWGVFTFSVKKSKFGSYEVTCPFHRKNASTGCKKLFSCRGP
eukprot:389810-Amphidinium_carterae.1